MKPSARAAVEALHAMGLQVAMITGDHARTAAAIAQQVGIDRVLAELLPHEKAAKVKELQAEGGGGEFTALATLHRMFRATVNRGGAGRHTWPNGRSKHTT
jgi:high-affinity K+ transport system ATPase subunit B